MENFLMCTNGKCGRHRVLVNADGRKYCSTCGSKLKVDKHQRIAEVGKNDDRPPINFVNGRQPTQLIMPTPPEMEDSWACNPDVKGCPVYKGKPKVEVPVEMWNEWVFMARQVKTEWFAYLKGELVGNGHYRVTEMYFPKQRVTASTVLPEEREVLPGTIGAVHSHVDMNAIFSGVDERHWSQPVEIVVNSRGEQDNRVRVQLDCGKWERFVGTLYLTNTDGVMAKVKELEGKVVQDDHQRQDSHARSGQQHVREGRGSLGYRGRTAPDWAYFGDTGNEFSTGKE